MKGLLKVGVVIFTKNEVHSIGRLIDGVLEHVDLNNIFVVDGHSTDGTLSVVAEKKVRFFLDNKMGKGAAIKLAIKKIDRDILVFMDSDGSHRPSEIPLLTEPFYHDDDVVMVIGSRFKGGSEELYGSIDEIARLIGNILITLLINLVWHSRLTDIQNGFRVVRRNAVAGLKLEEENCAIEEELTIKCLKHKMKILEIPSFELKRAYNKSHIIPHKAVPRFISCFIRNIFS